MICSVQRISSRGGSEGLQRGGGTKPTRAQGAAEDGSEERGHRAADSPLPAPGQCYKQCVCLLVCSYPRMDLFALANSRVSHPQRGRRRFTAKRAPCGAHRAALTRREHLRQPRAPPTHGQARHHCKLSKKLC